MISLSLSFILYTFYISTGPLLIMIILIFLFFIKQMSLTSFRQIVIGFTPAVEGTWYGSGTCTITVCMYTHVDCGLISLSKITIHLFSDLHKFQGKTNRIWPKVIIIYVLVCRQALMWNIFPISFNCIFSMYGFLWFFVLILLFCTKISFVYLQCRKFVTYY